MAIRPSNYWPAAGTCYSSIVPPGWTPTQKQRTVLMFERYPVLKQAYDLSMRLGDVFRHCTCKEQTFKKLALWYNQVEDAGIDSFRTVASPSVLTTWAYSTSSTTGVPMLRRSPSMPRSKLSEHLPERKETSTSSCSG